MTSDNCITCIWFNKQLEGHRENPSSQALEVIRMEIEHWHKFHYSTTVKVKKGKANA
tara:strand:- start:416 stop:586 length:171 start_codon:yes stop_codon:yes gene_type:complete